MKVFYKTTQLNNITETNYEAVKRKPAINSVELTGDKSTEDIKVTWFGTLAEFNTLPKYDNFTLYIIDDGVPVGVTKSYFYKNKKPGINGTELEGNKLPSDLDFYTADEINNLMASMRSVKVATELPAAPLSNTIYYVGPYIDEHDKEVYDIYLFDATLTEIYLGTTFIQVLTSGDGSLVVNNVVNVNTDNVSIDTNLNNEVQIKWFADRTIGEDDKKPMFLDKGVLKSFTHTITELVYPVGAIYKTITMSTVAQVEAALGGTWVALDNNHYLVNTTNNDAGTLINEQLPNIKGAIAMNYVDAWGDWALGGNDETSTTVRWSGAFGVDPFAVSDIGAGRLWQNIYGRGSDNRAFPMFRFNAHESSSVYTDSASVRPNSLQVYMYKRTA